MINSITIIVTVVKAKCVTSTLFNSGKVFNVTVSLVKPLKFNKYLFKILIPLVTRFVKSLVCSIIKKKFNALVENTISSIKISHLSAE